MGSELILVNEKNEITGYDEKLKVHEAGLLHRAFSVLILNKQKEMLLQKRAANKYHSGGLWSNACCSHPLKGEDFPQLVHRRLKEEMGFDCELKELFSFIYKTTFANGLSENEYDTVFLGHYNGKVSPNPKEASDFRWISMDYLKKELATKPEKYSVWLNEIVKRLDW